MISFTKSYFVIISFFVLSASIFSFQNCARTKFTNASSLVDGFVFLPPVSPICDPATRLSEFENIQCSAPNDNQLLARQFYNVICNENGQWSRVTKGPADYSQCPNSCGGTRPSDVENVFCPAPNGSLLNGLQRYTVTCLQEGAWSRTISGSVDYSACPLVCDPNTRPTTTSAVACPVPNSSLLSGIQKYTVTCNGDGTWGRTILGGADYSLCPQSCDPNTKPALTGNEKCPSSADMLAKRNYTVTCSANGTWSRIPGGLDTSLCPAPTCDPNTRPGSQDTIACPAPNTSSLLSKQNFTVSCSGTNWIRTPTTRDDSQCPRSCGTQPANDFTLVACQDPFQSTVLAKQNYTYTCNATTGQYARTIFGAIDYSSCPKSCTGPNPAVRTARSCPAGFSGTAYQNYSSTCNTTTGQWTTPVPTTIDNSGCSATTCTGTPPTNFDPVACPAPFESRLDAKKMYAAATCVNGSWVRGAATGVIDTSSCPVNDCSGSVNPGTEKDRGLCPGGATGHIFQTCTVVCTGNTYSQTNCSADNYSRCDCGPNAAFSLVTRTCVSTICSNGANNYPSCNICPAGQVMNPSTNKCESNINVSIAIVFDKISYAPNEAVTGYVSLTSNTVFTGDVKFGSIYGTVNYPQVNFLVGERRITFKEINNNVDLTFNREGSQSLSASLTVGGKTFSANRIVQITNTVVTTPLVFTTSISMPPGPYRIGSAVNGQLCINSNKAFTGNPSGSVFVPVCAGRTIAINHGPVAFPAGLSCYPFRDVIGLDPIPPCAGWYSLNIILNVPNEGSVGVTYDINAE